MKQNKKFYIWPCSTHSITLFQYGLDYTKLDGILDNSPNDKNYILLTHSNIKLFVLRDIKKEMNKIQEFKYCKIFSLKI